MNLCTQIASHLNNIYFGGNWSVANYKEVLEDIPLKQANKKLPTFNSITALVYHSNYYINALLKVLEGGSLEAKDALSFDHLEVKSDKDWQSMKTKSLSEAKKVSELIAQLEESKLWEPFTDEKYGNYYSNIHGIIEHCHYHLGQIVILKKMHSQK
ncbi:DinB family protein [Ulvibacter antarcticus]|uniref:DinB family protein n=1 Tax=Ulvibacter antarcticus TaxID=442714 RepID=A0A3L9YKI3_9FLAO|nr:DinB family protein [Ulvibacter antarcticus]RMA58508.1 DinB family protein [Ulvibacter antarcticus]